MAEQKYLITVALMCTSDEAEFVALASAVLVESDVSSPDLISDIAKLVTATREALDGAPLTNVRPMTDTEIEDWRSQN
jgi:hypothetical protein